MKMKTHSALKKRIKVTKRGKLKRRYSHQSHFNAREEGTKTRSKRGKVSVAKAYFKTARKLLPYS